MDSASNVVDLLRKAQQRLDDLAQPVHEDDYIDEDTALDSAMADLCCTPRIVTDALNDAATWDQFRPVDVADVVAAMRTGEREISAAEALVLLLSGPIELAQEARAIVNEALKAQLMPKAREDAALIVRAQDLEVAR